MGLWQQYTREYNKYYVAGQGKLYIIHTTSFQNKSIQFRHVSLENESLFNYNVLTGHSSTISVGSGTRCVQVKECGIAEIMATVHMQSGMPCVSPCNSEIYTDTTRLTPDNRL